MYGKGYQTRLQENGEVHEERCDGVKCSESAADVRISFSKITSMEGRILIWSLVLVFAILVLSRIAFGHPIALIPRALAM